MSEPDSSSEQKQPHDPGAEKLTLWQIVSSVLAAALGVQSDKNRERDFTKAKPTTYIYAGIIFTALFVLTLVVIVKLVLGNLE